MSIFNYQNLFTEAVDFIPAVGHHDLIPVYGTISGAMLKVKEWKSVDYPFERKYFIQCESGCEDFCWFVQREISATLEEKGMPDALAFPEEKVLFLEG